MSAIHLSIIIPVYNTPMEYLKECLESIKTSNIKYKYEIIIINDGSTEVELITFLNNYFDTHTLVINKDNSGVSKARNIGIEQAKGKLVLCLDSDDLILPEINTAIMLLKKNTDYDVLYCDVQFFGDTDYFFKKGEFSLFKLIYISNFLTPSSTLFRKSITEKILFNESLSYSEDKDFFARTANAGYKFKYLPIPFCKYRKMLNGESLSQKNLSKREDSENFIKNQFNPHQIITLNSVNHFIINNFKTNKKQFVKLAIIIFFPFIYNFFKNKKKFKNDYVIG
jgi:glycosyltransferase involved in cell wall biosynthesis